MNAIALRIYRRVISPLIHALAGPGFGCRFEPSCSVYFSEALERHGTARGMFFGLRRLSRCHPLGGCGFDPVPERLSSGK